MIARFTPVQDQDDYYEEAHLPDEVTPTNLALFVSMTSPRNFTL